MRAAQCQVSARSVMAHYNPHHAVMKNEKEKTKGDVLHDTGMETETDNIQRKRKHINRSREQERKQNGSSCAASEME